MSNDSNSSAKSTKPSTDSRLTRPEPPPVMSNYGTLMTDKIENSERLRNLAKAKLESLPASPSSSKPKKA